MSSGWNGIGIRGVGRTRCKLAKMLSAATGWIVEAHLIGRTNPINQHYEDCCAWDVWCDVPARPGQDGKMLPPTKGHIYSWDCMGDIVKRGVAVVNEGGFAGREPLDLEVCVDDPK